MKITELSFNDKEPIYHQIIEFVKKSVAIGELKAGDKLPSVREMSQALGVNPNTLQRAYGELERLEITYTKRGMGSYIKEDEDNLYKLRNGMVEEMVDKFFCDMKSIGIDDEEAVKIINKRRVGND